MTEQSSVDERAALLLDMARRAGADQVDVLLVEAEATSVGVAEGALEEAERSEGADIGLRVIVGKRQATVSSSDLAERTLREMAERAVAMAAVAPDDAHCGLAEASQLSDVSDIAALELSDPDPMPAPAELEAIARRTEAAALAVEGVTQVEQASASWSRDRVTILQSNGFGRSYARSSCGIGVSAIAGKGLGRERDYAAEGRRYWSDLPLPEEIGERAGRRAVALLGPKRPPSGHFPVLYDERVSSGLISHVLSAINGSAIARGSSWLRDQLGNEILPAGIDIVEDPLIVRGRASRPFDAEGLATARKALIADGVLRSWVLDLSTGRQLDMPSTANARRGVSGVPSPGVSNIRMTAGPKSRDELIRDMGRGLIVTSFIGLSINAATGAYSRGASGFWVEGGEIVHPVNEITLAGSLPDMIRTILPASDADPHKAISTPSLLVEGLTIGA